VEYLPTLIYLCPLVFLAGFVDSAAGGGGLISIPAYMLTGMPTHFAFGTNKLSAALGTFVSTGRFLRQGAIDVRTATISAISALIGSAVGSRLILSLDDRALKLFLVISLPCVAILLLLRKDKIHENERAHMSVQRTVVLATVIGLVIGLYDGMIGPGTGTFAAIAFNTFMKYDLKIATGNAKVLNLASNIASVVTFAFAGSVFYVIALPAAVFGIAGNFLGAGFALKKGASFIRPMLFIVLGLLITTMIYDFITLR